MTWLSEKLEIPFRMPDIHPFNPLPYLRLSIAVNNDADTVSKIFRAIWATEHDPSTPSGRQAIWEAIGIPNAEELIDNPEIKASLFSNTSHAAERGVFGVPTLIAGNELFWGLDSLDLLIDYLQNPDFFDCDQMRRLDTIQAFHRTR